MWILLCPKGFHGLFNGCLIPSPAVWVHAKSLQSCPTRCSPVDCSPPDSSVHGILQARILERLPCPPPRGLPDPEIEPTSLMSPTLAGGFFTTSTNWEAPLPAHSHSPPNPLPCLYIPKFQSILWTINQLFPVFLLLKQHSDG